MIFHRSTRTFISLLAVVALFFVYSAIARAIFGPVKLHAEPTSSIQQVRQATSQIAADRFVKHLASILPADAWELNDPKILRNEQTALIFKTYKQAEEDQVVIEPCTVVVLSKDSDTDRPPLILQAPQGAVMHFDGPLDLATATVGRPESGRLRGQISIQSPGDKQGKGKLLIKTSNVQINEKKLWTASDVEFQYDGSYGNGRDLIINLAPPSSLELTSELEAIESIELVHLKRLYLDPSSNDVFSRPNVPGEKAEANQNESPIQVECKGPCKLDIANGQIEFIREVDVRRLHVNARPDFLTCDNLVFSFETKLLNAKHSKGDSSHGFKQLIATGSPVILSAPSRFAYLKGSRIIYNWESKSFRVDAEEQSIFQLRKGESQHYFAARNFTYQLLDDREIGEFVAAGPGEYLGKFAGERDAKIIWKGLLELKPFETGHLLLVNDDVDAKMAADGRIVADRFRVLFEDGPRQLGTTQQDTAFSTSLRPKRFLANGRVNFTSPKLNANCEELEIAFHHRANGNYKLRSGNEITRAIYGANESQIRLTSGPDRAVFTSETNYSPAPQSSTLNVAANSSRQGIETQKSNREIPKMDLSGDQIQLSLVMVRNEIDEIQNVRVKGMAKLSGSQIRNGIRNTFRMAADILNVKNPNSGAAIIQTAGRPSEIQFDDFRLQAENIYADQGRNRFWIDVPGIAFTKIDKNLQGERLPAPIPARLTWQQSMTFDGNRFEFAGQAQVSTEDTEINAGRIFGHLNETVRFNEKKQNQQIEIASLSAADNVQVAYRTREFGRITATSFFHGPSLHYERESGNVDAKGPGYVVLINRGFKAGPGLTRNALPEPEVDQRFTYLRTDFRNNLTANIEKRRGVFYGDVDLIYGPIFDWNEEIPLEQPLGKDDIRLNCDSMELTQIPTPSSHQKAADVRAVGNVLVRGQLFSARGHQLLFDQYKSLMTLKGSGSQDAEIQFQSSEGKGRLETSGQELRFSPETLDLQFNKQRFLDFRTFSR